MKITVNAQAAILGLRQNKAIVLKIKKYSMILTALNGLMEFASSVQLAHSLARVANVNLLIFCAKHLIIETEHACPATQPSN